MSVFREIVNALGATDQGAQVLSVLALGAVVLALAGLAILAGALFNGDDRPANRLCALITSLRQPATSDNSAVAEGAISHTHPEGAPDQ